MYSRDNSYSTPDQADFSSVFMRATSAEQVSAMQMLDEEAVRAATNANTRELARNENRNLSSIIAQIQDEGSAVPQSKKVVRWKRKCTQQSAQTVRTKATSAQQKQTQPGPVAGNSFNQPDAPVFTSSTVNTASQNSKKEIPAKRQSQSLFLLMAMTAVAVMGYYIYQLNDRADALMSVLDSYEEQIEDLSATQAKSSDTLLTVSSMEQTLADIRQELQAVKADYAEFDSKLVKNDVDAQLPKLMELVVVEQNVRELETTLASTRSEMIVMKPVTEDVRGVHEVKSEQTPHRGGWVVNLASLSSMEQARIGATMLEKSGRVPVIQEIMVNGRTLYRLSVEGFTTRNEAVQFISEAKKQYGFEGGWVRQG